MRSGKHSARSLLTDCRAHLGIASTCFVLRPRIATVSVARDPLGDRAEVWCEDVLDLDLADPVDVIVSTAALHWVPDHDRMWARLAGALRPGGILEAQCGGEGNIARVREVIDTLAQDAFPEFAGWSPWVFASPPETERRLRGAGFTTVRCWLEDQRIPRTSIRLSAPRSWRHTSPNCPRNDASRSPRPSWPVCARHWATFV